MKKVSLTILAVLGIAQFSCAQWTTNGNNINNTNTGNIGIGTPTPAEKLTVNGNIRIMPLVDNTGLFGYDAATGGNSIFSFTRQTNNLSIAAYDGIGFSVAAHTGATTNYSMFISNAGNVGIGITNPQNKLDVKGKIHSQSVVIDMLGWADYVFKKDYQLPPLQEVKAYIDQNQHLPEIPSEQQIAKEGLNLGEMNKLLIKKVEELTLYLIEKDKKDTMQEERITEQEKRIKDLEFQIKSLLKK
jgi:hypothetical protein